VLLGPSLAQRGVTLEVEGSSACAVGGDLVAARLALLASLLAVDDALREGSTAETAGTKSAIEPARRVRCTMIAGNEPAIEIAPWRGATMPTAVERALAEAGIVASTGHDVLRLAFPTLDAP
jgi:hypothetical protein